MGDNYLFYCKNCNDLEIGVRKSNLICDACGSKRIPLGVTEDDWNTYSEEEAREILKKANSISVSDDSEFYDDEDDYGQESVSTTRSTSSYSRNSRVKNVSANYNTRNDKPIKNEDGRVSGMSIAAIILSILGCTGIIGVILGIIDVRRPDNRKKGLSIAAIIIGTLFFAVFCFFAAFTEPGSGDTKDEEVKKEVKLSANMSYNHLTGEAIFVIAGDDIKKGDKYTVNLSNDKGYNYHEEVVAEVDNMVGTSSFTDGEEGLKGVYTLSIYDSEGQFLGSTDFTCEGKTAPTETPTPTPTSTPTPTTAPKEEETRSSTEKTKVIPDIDELEYRKVDDVTAENFYLAQSIDKQGSTLSGEKVLTYGRIYNDANKDGYVQISVPDTFHGIDCYLAKDSDCKLSDLKNDDTVVIVGTISGSTDALFFQQVQMKNCYIVRIVDTSSYESSALEAAISKMDDDVEGFFEHVGYSIDGVNIDTTIPKTSSSSGGSGSGSLFGTSEIDTSSAIETTAKTVYKEMQDNQVSCKNKYDGKTVKIKGIIDDIGTNVFGQEYVAFETGDPYSIGSVQCFFRNDQMDYVAGLKKGQTITLYGIADVGSMSFKVGECRPAD